MSTKKRVAILLGLIIGLYVLSYVILSPFGKYAVIDWHLFVQRGPPTPRWYHWAPPSFYEPSTGEWRVWIVRFYLPLWVADDWFWHTHGWHPELSHSPMYPAVFPASTFKSASH